MMFINGKSVHILLRREINLPMQDIFKKITIKYLLDLLVQVLHPTPDQSNTGSACHMTRSANHCCHSTYSDRCRCEIF